MNARWLAVTLVAFLFLGLVPQHVQAVGGIQEMDVEAINSTDELLDYVVEVTETTDGNPFSVSVGYNGKYTGSLTKYVCYEDISYDYDWNTLTTGENMLGVSFDTTVRLYKTDPVYGLDLLEEFLLNSPPTDTGNQAHTTPPEFSRWSEENIDGSVSIYHKYMPQTGIFDGSWFQVELRLDEYPYDTPSMPNVQQPVANVIFSYNISTSQVTDVEMEMNIYPYTASVRNNNAYYEQYGYYEWFSSESNAWWQFAPSSYVVSNTKPSILDDDEFINVTYINPYFSAEFVGERVDVPLFLWTSTGSFSSAMPSAGLPNQYSASRAELMRKMCSQIEGEIDLAQGKTHFVEGENVTVQVTATENEGGEPDIYDVLIEFISGYIGETPIIVPDDEYNPMSYSFHDLDKTTTRASLLDGNFTMEKTFQIPLGLENDTYYILVTVSDLLGNPHQSTKAITVGGDTGTVPSLYSFGAVTAIDIGKPTTFAIIVLDESDWVEFMIDWGDGNTDDWIRIETSSGGLFTYYIDHTYEASDVYHAKIYLRDSDGEESEEINYPIDATVGEERILDEMANNPFVVIGGAIILFGILFIIRQLLKAWQVVKARYKEVESELEGVTEREGYRGGLSTAKSRYVEFLKEVIKPQVLGWLVYTVIGLFVVGLIYWAVVDSSRGLQAWEALGLYVNNVILYVKTFAFWLSTRLLGGKIDYTYILWIFGMATGVFLLGSLLGGARVVRR